MKTEEGMVMETHDGVASVKIGRHSECENCGACPGGGAALVRTKNGVDAKAGQRVLVEVQSDQTLKGAFLVFILPLVSLFAGVYLGGLASAALSLGALPGRIAGGVVLMGLAVLAIHLTDRKIGGAGIALPKIIKIIG
jgi:sigma-E factor negative regulatory protein RseC